MSAGGAPPSQLGIFYDWASSIYPDPRSSWTGSDLVIFASTPAGRYDPCLDVWRSIPVPPTNGGGNAVARGDGGVYTYGTNGSTTWFSWLDFAANAWRPLSTNGAPPASGPSIAVVAGKVVFWGGTMSVPLSIPLPTNAGAVYDPASDHWTPTTMTGAPAPRAIGTAALPNVVAAGDRLFVWGGAAAFSVSNLHAPDPVVVGLLSQAELDCGGSMDPVECSFGTGALYDPTADRWTPVATAGAPRARHQHQTFWTGTRIIIWGGNRNDANPTTGSPTFVSLHDGAVFDPDSNAWTALAPPPGDPSTAVMVLVAGRLVALDRGAVYDEKANHWDQGSPLTGFQWSTCLSPVVFGDHVVADCGARILVGDPLHAGAATLSIDVAADAPRDALTAWTGTQLLRWGGYTLGPTPPNTCMGMQGCDPLPAPQLLTTAGSVFTPGP